MVNNSETISLLKATIDHNSKQAGIQINGEKDKNKQAMIKASFDEILDGHFDLLKMFVFIDLVESNKLNMNHINDIINQHLDIINAELNEDMNDAARRKAEYNKKLWDTIKTKMSGYLALLNPVE
jgi:hypothetical protein